MMATQNDGLVCSVKLWLTQEEMAALERMSANETRTKQAQVRHLVLASLRRGGYIPNLVRIPKGEGQSEEEHE
jgi:hypothetical protein